VCEREREIGRQKEREREKKKDRERETEGEKGRERKIKRERDREWASDCMFFLMGTAALYRVCSSGLR